MEEPVGVAAVALARAGAMATLDPGKVQPYHLVAAVADFATPHPTRPRAPGSPWACKG